MLVCVREREGWWGEREGRWEKEVEREREVKGASVCERKRGGGEREKGDERKGCEKDGG